MVYSQYTGMKFGLKICYAHREKWKNEITEGIELSNLQKNQKTWEKENYK